jgi:hypothetical protein
MPHSQKARRSTRPLTLAIGLGFKEIVSRSWERVRRHQGTGESLAHADSWASAHRPLTLYARVGKGEVALGRWPTTIGGWKTIEKSDGSMALKYKESVTGDAVGPEVLATRNSCGWRASKRHWSPKGGLA